MPFYIPYKSADEIPMGEFKKLHKSYWEFIAATGGDCKPPIVSVVTGEEVEIFATCFACEYKNQLSTLDLDGNKCCPLRMFDLYDSENFEDGTWKGGCSTNEDSPYKKWCFATNPEDREKYALEIANLEWRDTYAD